MHRLCPGICGLEQAPRRAPSVCQAIQRRRHHARATCDEGKCGNRVVRAVPCVRMARGHHAGCRAVQCLCARHIQRRRHAGVPGLRAGNICGTCVVDGVRQACAGGAVAVLPGSQQCEVLSWFFSDDPRKTAYVCSWKICGKRVVDGVETCAGGSVAVLPGSRQCEVCLAGFFSTDPTQNAAYVSGKLAANASSTACEACAVVLQSPDHSNARCVQLVFSLDPTQNCSVCARASLQKIRRRQRVKPALAVALPSCLDHGNATYARLVFSARIPRKTAACVLVARLQTPCRRQFARRARRAP